MIIQDELKSLEYILDDYYDSGQINSYFVKILSLDNENIYYGRLDVEIGQAEKLNDHCEQCFNDPIMFLKFKTRSNLCDFVGIGIVGLKKFSHFKEKNELHKILPNIEIIDILV